MTQIALVGEAYGAEEEKQQAPFVGAAGYELTRMLDEAGIHRADCFLTNVFNRRPRANRIEDFCGPKHSAISGWPALTKAQYVRAEFENELVRLGSELVDANPNVVVALGNTAMWALCGKVAISKFRGTTMLSTHAVGGFKVLPTYHPAAILRQWELRPIGVVDLIKAGRESEYPEIRRPNREIWIEPTIDDLYLFRDQYIKEASLISVDIETYGRQITCLAIAPSRSVVLVISFYGKRGRYWKTASEERAAWDFIREVLEQAPPRKIFQNGLFDVAFLWRAYGIRTFGCEHDTLLLHHALQPESTKALGFLGSVYTDEDAWKQDRRSSTIKRDE